MQAGFFHEVRKAIATEGRTDDSSDDEKGNDSDNNGDIPADKQFISRKRKNVDKKRLKRLRLDEALKNVDEGNFEGWSEARIRAWQLKDKNPNAYYYRFNDPGVEQRNGTWNKVPTPLPSPSPSPSHPTSSSSRALTVLLPWLLHVFKEERALFFQRVEEIGVNGQWGIFSMVIPGRVGYQCSNFYRYHQSATSRYPHVHSAKQHAERFSLSCQRKRCRHLVETGQVVDPNYVIDEKGKAHYLFSKGICKHTKSHKRKDPGTWTALRVGSLKWWTDFSFANLAAVNMPDDAPQVKVKQQGKKRKGRTQKKKKGKEEDEDAHEEDDDEYVPPSSLKKQKGDGTRTPSTLASSNGSLIRSLFRRSPSFRRGGRGGQEEREPSARVPRSHHLGGGGTAGHCAFWSRHGLQELEQVRLRTPRALHSTFFFFVCFFFFRFNGGSHQRRWWSCSDVFRPMVASAR
jgi:hypothetical protein